MSIGGGKSSGGGTQITTQQLTPEQRAQIQAQTQFFTGTVAPAYQGAIQNAAGVYNMGAPNVNAAAQNLASASATAQDKLATRGSSALDTGISTLERLGGADYTSQQLQAALQPAQAQYTQNLANLGAQYGGAGQIGSQRQAIAQQALAGQTQASQQQAAAQVLNNVAQLQAGVGTNLANLGQSGLAGAQNAATNAVTASMAPQQLYNQYASVIFGTPSASYTPNFQGTQGTTTTSSQAQQGIGFSGLGSGFKFG